MNTEHNFLHGKQLVRPTSPARDKDYIPRRARMQYWCPAEKAIQDAVDAVEVMGADVRLTHAVILLGKARDKVADFIDAVESE